MSFNKRRPLCVYKNSMRHFNLKNLPDTRRNESTYIIGGKNRCVFIKQITSTLSDDPYAVYYPFIEHEDSERAFENNR